MFEKYIETSEILNGKFNLHFSLTTAALLIIIVFISSSESIYFSPSFLLGAIPTRNWWSEGYIMAVCWAILLGSISYRP